MNPEEINEIELHCESWQTGKDTSQENFEFLQQLKNPEKIPLLRALYEADNRKNSLYFNVATTISEIIDENCPQWNFENIENITNWIISVTKEKSMRDHSAVKQLVKSIPVIFYKATPDRKDFIGKTMSQIYELTELDIPSLLNVLYIFNELLTGFDDATKEFRMEFSQNNSEFIFRTAFSCFTERNESIKQAEDLTQVIYETALLVCKNCLRFTTNKPDKTSLGQTGPQGRKAISRPIQLTQRLKDVISDPEVLRVFIQFYRETEVQDAMMCAQDMLNCKIETYAEGAIPNLIAEAFQQILEFFPDGQYVFQDTKTIRHISGLLDVIVEKIDSNRRGIDTISQIPNFSEFIDRFTPIAISIFDQRKVPLYEEDDFIGMLSFYKKLFNLSSNLPDYSLREFLAERFLPLCQYYIQYLYTSVADLPDNQLYHIWPSTGGISSLVLPIQVLITTGPPAIFESINASVNDIVSQLSAATKPDPNTVAVLQKQLGVFLMVINSALHNIIANATDTSVENYSIHLFSLALNILRESENWIQQGMVAVELEKSIVSFIASHKEFEFFKTTSKGNDIYQSLRSIGAVVGDKNQAFELIAHRLLLTLMTYSDKNLISSALSKIVDVISNSQDTVAAMVHDPTASSFPFMLDQMQMKNVSLFFSSLMQVLFKNFTDGIEPLLTNVGEYIQNANDAETFRWACYAVRGMFLAATKPENFSTLFDWFYPRVCQILIQKTIGNVGDLVIAKSSLKMFCSIVENRPLDRIKFPTSSNAGIGLFEKCTELLSTILDAMYPSQGQEVAEEQFPVFIAACRIIEFFLKGNYVCFDAFKIYNSTVFSDLIMKYLNIIPQISFEVMFSYPKLTIAITKFLSSLCTKQLGVLLDEASEFIGYLFEFCNRLLLNPGLRTDTQNLICTILKDLARRIVDEAYETQSQPEIYTQNEAVIERTLIIFWQSVCTEIIQRAIFCEPLKLFLIISIDKLDAILEQITQFIPEEKREAFESDKEEFKDNLENILDDEKDSSAFMNRLTLFQKQIKSKVVNINLLQAFEE